LSLTSEGQLKKSEYAASLNPTIIVLPTCKVGARKFPVGPNIEATASSETPVLSENSLTFLPLSAINLLALASMASPSCACNFLLAGTFVLMSMLLASKNLDAFVQLVQPPR
jgi:hypothetical protein